MKIPSPSELGLPAKFSQWRANQEHFISVIITAFQRGKRAVIGCAPTGFGKQIVAVATALLTGEPTCIVTASRGLETQYMCVALGTRVLSGDLIWRPAESYSIGDVVLGFDEFRLTNRRMWRKSIVESVSIIEKPCYRLTLVDGTVVCCSSDHKWLTGVSRRHGLTWVSTDKIKAGFQHGGHYLNKVLDVWPQRKDHTSGYLAAAFDGEGSFHQSSTSFQGKNNSVSVHLTFSQNAGVVLDTVIQMMNSVGIAYRLDAPGKNDKCYKVVISDRRNVLRFLGEMRPVRLLPKLNLNLLGMLNPANPVLVVDKEFIGNHPVVALKTSTHTFVAEGLASHNSNFQDIGMVDIRGKQNYQCEMREDYSCEEGQAAQCPYKGSIGCPASAAEIAASTSRLVVTNYSKWCLSRKYGKGMSHFTQVIFDEFHEAPSAIANAMHVTLHHREIEHDLGIDFPTGAAVDDFANWKQWAVNARGACELAIREAWNKIQSTVNPKPAWVKQYVHLRNLQRRLLTLSTGKIGNWIVEEHRDKKNAPDGYQFDPIRLGMYSEGALLLGVPRILGLSATARPKTGFMVGLSKESFEFHEFDSDFDPRRCPIYYIPTMRVDRRSENMMAHLWLRLDQILSKRRDRKGIIHTVSYMRQQDILGTSRFADSMIINERGEPPTEMIEKFRVAPDGTILVSPSVGTGYDFKDDDCRYQFLCKIPFQPPSKIVKAREDADNEYRGYMAMQAMVQSFGRDMRSKTDWSERFICDDHLKWFLPRFGHLAPRSFHGFFRPVSTLPQPPRKEDMTA